MADGILIGDLPSAAALTPASDFTYLQQPSQSSEARKVTVANLLAPALKGPYYIYTVDAGSGSTLGLSMETGQHMSVRFSGTAAFTTVQVPDGEYVGQIVAITNDRAINLTVVAEAPSTLHKTIVLGNGDSCTLTWEGGGSWRAEAETAAARAQTTATAAADATAAETVRASGVESTLANNIAAYPQARSYYQGDASGLAAIAEGAVAGGPINSDHAYLYVTQHSPSSFQISGRATFGTTPSTTGGAVWWRFNFTAPGTSDILDLLVDRLISNGILQAFIACTATMRLAASPYFLTLPAKITGTHSGGAGKYALDVECVYTGYAAPGIPWQNSIPDVTFSAEITLP